MEDALVLWIEDMNNRSLPLDTKMIQAKAMQFYNFFLASASPSDIPNVPFTASKGWFQKFKKRHGLHNVKLQGEIASADLEAAAKFPDEFKDLIEKEGYTRHQIFNADETRLFYKKMPHRSFIVQHMKSVPGRKIDKKACTLMFCCNSSGSMMLKPVLINNVNNPRALKNVDRGSMPVTYYSNQKGWMTSSIMTEWFNKEFVPNVREMCDKENLAFKAILVLDNAPSHPKDLSHPNVKIVYLPPNTTSVIQPLDQGVIAAFKLHYVKISYTNILAAIEDGKVTLLEAWKAFNIRKCIESIGEATKKVTPETIRNCWKKLLPTDTIETGADTDGLVEEIKVIGEKMGIDGMANSDVTELLAEQETTLDEIVDCLQYSEEDNDECVVPQPETIEFGAQLDTLNSLMHFITLDCNEERAAEMHNLLLQCEQRLLEWKREVGPQETGEHVE